MPDGSLRGSLFNGTKTFTKELSGFVQPTPPPEDRQMLLDAIKTVPDDGLDVFLEVHGAVYHVIVEAPEDDNESDSWVNDFDDCEPMDEESVKEDEEDGPDPDLPE